MRDQYALLDQVRAWIVRDLGERCDDHDPNCMTCQAWAAFDTLNLLDEQCNTEEG